MLKTSSYSANLNIQYVKEIVSINNIS